MTTTNQQDYHTTHLSRGSSVCREARHGINLLHNPSEQEMDDIRTQLQELDAAKAQEREVLYRRKRVLAEIIQSDPQCFLEALGVGVEDDGILLLSKPIPMNRGGYRGR